MASTIIPLQLTTTEQEIIKHYLNTFKTFQDTNIAPHEYGDPFKLSECLCLCDRLKQDMKRLYAYIPQSVKDEHLVPSPEYPYYH